jgi:hypothetical protein
VETCGGESSGECRIGQEILCGDATAVEAGVLEGQVLNDVGAEQVEEEGVDQDGVGGVVVVQEAREHGCVAGEGVEDERGQSVKSLGGCDALPHVLDRMETSDPGGAAVGVKHGLRLLKYLVEHHHKLREEQKREEQKREEQKREEQKREDQKREE